MLLMNYPQITAMAISLQFSIADVSTGPNGLRPKLSILNIYSGTIPTVDANYIWNPSSYDGQLLFTMPGITFSQVSATGQGAVGVKFPSAYTNRVATGTGTATWFAIHNGVVGGPAIIGSVTANGAATDTLLLSTTSLVNDGLFSILDFTLRFLG